jgi:hypothetical protein
MTNGFSITDGIVLETAPPLRDEMRALSISRALSELWEACKTVAKETGFESATPCLQNVRLHDTVFRESSRIVTIVEESCECNFLTLIG